MKLAKFIPFAKVDEAKREVWGIVTAEVPDKDGETCRYEPTKKNYKAWAAEFQKATDGDSVGNLREMHQLKAAGRGIGIEFDDDSREIRMGFKVVDDGAWTKVIEKVYTGFSQGGEYQDGPDASGFYTANPSEVSLVDNPCLGIARYALVRASGAVEMVKIRSVSKDSKTKRVAGEDLPASAFAHVGDPEDPSTWKLPIKFSTDEKSASHVRNALARFGQTEGLSSEDKAKAKAKITAAARHHGIEVSGDKAMEFTAAQLESLSDVLLAKLGGKVVAKASVHDHMKKAMEHHAKAMGHIVDAMRAHEDGNHEEAEPHVAKAHKAMEMCHKCMGKAADAMGLDSADISGGEEPGERGEKAAKARKAFEAAGLKGAALEKAVAEFTGQPTPVTAESIGAVVEEKLAAMLKAMFGKTDDEDDDDHDEDEKKPVEIRKKAGVQQTSRRVTKTEDNASDEELERLRVENTKLRKAVERTHDPEGALDLLVKDKGKALTQDEAFKMGIVK